MQRSAPSTAWPRQVALDRPGDREVRADDGRVFELHSFRDACQLRAAELRRAAVADLRAAAGSAFSRWRRAVAQQLRPAAATFSHPRQRSST